METASIEWKMANSTPRRHICSRYSHKIIHHDSPYRVPHCVRLYIIIWIPFMAGTLNLQPNSSILISCKTIPVVIPSLAYSGTTDCSHLSVYEHFLKTFIFLQILSLAILKRRLENQPRRKKREKKPADRTNKRNDKQTFLHGFFHNKKVSDVSSRLCSSGSDCTFA